MVTPQGGCDTGDHLSHCFPWLPVYEDQLDKYNKQLQLESAADDDTASSASVVLIGKTKRTPPARPNELVPYSADIFGLDKARRDCRFEMIKIVKEVRRSVYA